MSGNPDTEQWQNFNERLSQWISKQGFWFQLKHSLSRGGSKGKFTYYLLRLSARLVMFLGVVALLWLFVFNEISEEAYVKDLSESIRKKFGAEEVDLKGYSHIQGNLQINSMAMIGDEKSFFSGLEFANLRCDKSHFQNLKKTWDPGLIEISEVDLTIHAGADTESESKAIADVIFQNPSRFKLKSIRVADMSLNWGYSSRTRGAISESKMRATRLSNGWRLLFQGGTFTQSWLKRLEIVELEAIITREGILFKKAVFKRGHGVVILRDLKIKGGQRPQVSGNMKLSNVDISSIIPLAVREYAEGSMSGEFKVSGSTNSSEGISFKGKVQLEDDDKLSFRDKLPLLRALSVIDSSNNYKVVNFRKGSFDLETKGGSLFVKNVDLVAGKLMTLKGEMLVRRPNADEDLVFGGSNNYFGEILDEDELGESLKLSLSEAASNADQNQVGFRKEKEGSLFGKLLNLDQDRRKQQVASERLSKSYRYEGKLQITLMKEAFSKSPRLDEQYPVLNENDRILIPVPIAGVINDLTSDLAEEFYKKGAREN